MKEADIIAKARNCGLCDPDFAEEYVKEEIRELELSGTLESFIKDATAGKYKGAKNPHNILLYHLFGAEKPTEFVHHYTGGDIPDVDLDFDPEGRDAIKTMLKKRFGERNCMEVMTVGSVHVKSAIQDLARINGIPPAEVTAVTTQIKHNPNDDSENTLEYILENNPPVAKWLRQHPEILEWIEKMQDVKRNVSRHASAFIVSSVPIDEHIPVITASVNGKRELITGFPESSAVKSLQEMGFIKLDILGVEHLNVIGNTLKELKRRHGITIDWDTVNVDDPAVYKAIRKGYTAGAFQINSGLGLRVIKTILPELFSDLVALNSLIRPSCLEADMHIHYKKHKMGKFNPVEFPVWKDLKGKVSDFTYSLLDMTYGTCIFQEQIMALLADFCGISFEETSKARKIIGIPAPKQQPEHKEYIGKLYRQWMDNGSALVGTELAQQWWDVAVGSLMYGFNLSHATSYAMTAFREMYLKVHYPDEFFFALIKTAKESKGHQNLMTYITEANMFDVNIEAPHINKSEIDITYADDKIYIGIGQVKGIGPAAAKKIVANRPYNSFMDFVEKSGVGKTAVESLIYANAFRDYGDRQDLLREYAVYRLPKTKKNQEVEVPSKFEILKKESDVLNIVLSERSPLKLPYGYISLSKAVESRHNKISNVMGVCEKITYHTSRNGNKYARLELNDLITRVSVLVWSNMMGRLEPVGEGDVVKLAVKHLDGDTFSLVNIKEIIKDD